MLYAGIILILFSGMLLIVHLRRNKFNLSNGLCGSGVFLLLLGLILLVYSILFEKD
jgi:hypothetical protein